MEHYPAPGRNHLFVPDPTNDLEPILRAINRSNEDHRSPAFSKLSKSVLDDVKQIFRTTTATSFIFSTTGWLYTSPWTPLLSFHNSSTQFERPAD
jgi:alanine-glyoxylate transaminase/serine-glyoxylate transaminase/serine-pyruvate transaminase